MGEPVRVQRKRTKGWKMPDGAVYVGRPTRFGNPFKVGQDGSHDQCVALHRGWLTGTLPDHEIRQLFPRIAEWLINMRHPRLGAILRELPDKSVACFCPLDHSCHADVLLELANAATPPRAGGQK